MRPTRGPKPDELLERRLIRERARLADGRLPQDRRGEDPDGDAEPMHFAWSDVAAMIIAAYQVVLPILGIFIAIVLGIYLLLRLLL